MRYLTALLFLLATTVAGADSTITYQGQLQDASGPVDDTVDMSFALFENETGGDPVGGPIALPGVSVVDGLFQVALDFGDQDYASGLWLAVEVAGEPLAPRQAITGVPFAISAAPGSGSNWEPSGPHIHYVDGRVGIGTSLPSARLDVVGSAKFGDSSNEASGGQSFVGGGQNNQATGGRGFVGGGAGNVAAGVNSFVAGTENVTVLIMILSSMKIAITFSRFVPRAEQSSFPVFPQRAPLHQAFSCPRELRRGRASATETPRWRLPRLTLAGYSKA